MNNFLPHGVSTQLLRQGPAAVVIPVLIPRYSVEFLCNNLCVFSQEIFLELTIISY